MISKPVDIPVKSDVTGMIEIKKKRLGDTKKAVI